MIDEKFSGQLVLSHYQTLLIPTLNFSNKSNAVNIIIFH